MEEAFLNLLSDECRFFGFCLFFKSVLLDF